MDHAAWIDPAIVAWIAERAVAIQIDVDVEKELAVALAVRTLPTLIVFREGAEVDRIVGLRQPEAVLAWIELSQALGEEDVVLAWFDANSDMIHAQPEIAAMSQHHLVRILTARGRWADASRFFRDPIETLRSSHAQLDRVRPMGDRVIAEVEQMIRRDAAVMSASFQAAGRDADARTVADEIRRLIPGEATEQVLAQIADEAARHRT